MSFSSLKKNIVDQDLCTSCGLCISVCPGNILVFSDDGIVPVPVLKSETEGINSCSRCGLCEKVCAGYDSRTNVSETAIFGTSRTQEERWTGIYINAYQLAAKNLHILRRAGSGGAGTVLAITALKEKIVDAILVVGRDTEKPWTSKAMFIDSAEKAVLYAQTTYCITPNLHLLRDIPYKKIGIIGLPCQIQAVRKLMHIKNDPEAEKVYSKITFLIELACSSNTTREGTEYIIADLLKIPLKEVAEVRYREGGYPGNFMVKTKDKKKYYYPFYKMVEEFKNFKTFRCNVCPDWWSGLADISIADGAPDIYALSKQGQKYKPSSTVLTRTDTGQKLINLAYKNGLIYLHNDLFINNLGLERKRQRYRAYMNLSERKIPIPPGKDNYYDSILTDEEVLACGVDSKKYAFTQRTAK